MAHAGIPLRSHYFWPLFAAAGKENDVKTVFDVIGMMTELNVLITLDTLTDYVLPALQSLSTDQIIDQFKTRYGATVTSTAIATVTSTATGCNVIGGWWLVRLRLNSGSSKLE